MIRSIQNLPERSAVCALYLLLRELPIEAYLDSRKLNFFGSIARQADTKVHELAIRQLAMKDSKSKSWFIDIYSGVV